MNERGDLIRWVDHLRWRDLCFTADGNGFQSLFERAMERLEPETFEAVAPYGNLGDRKTDGILYGEGAVYQVYSPWELKLAPALRKIREDLAGAVANWGDGLKSWTFVYNTRNRQALPADILQAMGDHEAEHPEIEFHRLSDKHLWRRIREELDVDDRWEILGPMPEALGGTYFPSRAVSEADLRELERSRLVLLHEVGRPIDLTAAIQALEPELSFGPPVRLRPMPNEVGWARAAAEQKAQLEELIDEAGDRLSRVALFSLSDIPLLLHLGFVLSDRLDVRLFQYHRDRRSWAWGEATDLTTNLTIDGLPDEVRRDEGEVALLVSLSARIREEQVVEVSDGLLGIVRLSADEPSVEWLQSPDQLRALQIYFRRLLARIVETWPSCTRIHLFYAGPAPGAVAVGQVINPRMIPPVVTYQFDGEYSPAIELCGDVLAR